MASLKLSLLLGLWLLGGVVPAQAQVDPSVDPLPIPAPLPDTSPLEGSPPPVAPPPPAESPAIAVTRIQIQGSTLFSPADLAPLTAPYENRLVTLADLQTLVQTLAQRYLEAGYITTQVRLPEQVISDGVVTIEVLEGALTEVVIPGGSRYQDYITSRLNVGGTAPLNQPGLEDQLQLLQLGGLFRSVQGQLQAGDRPGTSRLTLTLEEASPWQGEVFSDNYSPSSVGSIRAGGRLGYRSLLTPGDSLNLSATSTTTGGAQAYGVSYQLPLGPRETTLRLGFTSETFRVTEAGNPAQALGIRGGTRLYEVALRQPIVRTAQEELAIGVGFRYRDGESVLLDTITLPNRTSVLQFFQEYLRRDGSGAWVARSQFNLGTGLLNATTNPDPLPDGRFLSWVGQVQRVQRWHPDHLLIVRLDGQLSQDSLLGSEQFAIGGATSVRGFRQNVRSGDGGIRFSLENRYVAARRADGEPLLQWVPAVDLGAVWFQDSSRQPTQQNFIAGLGLGAIVTPTPGLEARLEVGIPLTALTEISDRGQGGQVYFSLGYRW